MIANPLFVELPHHAGTISIGQHARPGGAVVHTLRGSRLRGTVVVAPYVRDDQPVPDRYTVLLGDDGPIEQLRSGLPVVDNVVLYGSAGPVDLTETSWTSQLRLGRLQSASLAEPVPITDTVRQLLVDVLGIVGAQHLLLDQDALMMAAARATAAARARRCARTILATWRTLRDLRAELAMEHDLAEQLQALSPLPLVPARARRCGGWHPCLDPDSYLSADDDGDWLTCPTCHRPTVMVEAGDRLGALLAAHADHRCT